MKSLNTVLDGFEAFAFKLKHVCRLIARKYSKQRLLETCFKDPPLCFFKDEFRSFSAHVYEARWASVSVASGKVLTLGRYLREGWSILKYTFKDGNNAAGGDVRNDPTDEGRLDIQVVDEAIKSWFFWAYALMIDMVAEMHEIIMNWGESCACHWKPVTRLQGPERHRPRRRMHEFAKKFKNRCPLSGMRAAELAAGA